MTFRPPIRCSRPALLALLFAAIAACNSDPQTVVFVKLNGRQAMREFATLDIVVANGGGSASQSFTLGRDDRLPLTFTVTPTGRSGKLDISATARFTDGTLAGRGQGFVDIAPDKRVDVELTLEPDDFVVNKSIADDQFIIFDRDQAGRQMAVAPDGSFITTFENDCPLDRCDMLARRFDRTTTPAINGSSGDDGDLIVNQSAQYGESPTIAAGTNEYFVVWLSRPDNQFGERDVKATVLGLDGRHALDFDIDVSIAPEDDSAATVFRRADGSYVVLWTRERVVDAHEVRARLYGADGTPLAAEFLVATAPLGDQLQPHGVGLTGGGFAIVWLQGDGVSSNVLARVFGADASPTTGNLSITSYAGAAVYSPRVAATSDGFVVGWQAFESGAAVLGDRPLIVHRYSATGASLSTDIPVATRTAFFQAAPALAIRPGDGAIGVAWPDCGELGDVQDTCAIRFRLLRSTGMPVGESIVVNTTTAGNQRAPTIQAAPADGFLLGWTDESMQAPDDRGSSVRARVVYPALERHDGNVGALCGAASDTACAEGLSCQPAADSTPLCHPVCTSGACPSGGVCLNNAYCNFP